MHCAIYGSGRTGNLTEKAKDQEQTSRFKWNKDKKEALHDLMRTEGVQKAANELKRSFDLEGVSVDENAAQFTNLIRDAALRSGAAVYHHDRQSQGKKHFPQNAWFDEDCKKQKRLVNDLWKRWRAEPSKLHVRDHFWAEKKKFKALVRRKKREAIQEENQRILTAKISDPQEFWKMIKARKKTKTNPAASVPIDEWFKYFRDLHKGGEGDTSVLEDEDIDLRKEDDLDVEIQVEEVKEVIKKMATGKSPGEDGLIAEVYKCLSGELLEALTALFNKIFSTGKYPQSWSTGLVCPVYKAGDPEQASNYRGITLLDVVSKIFSGVLCQRMKWWCDDNQIISDYQFGFRAGRRTMDAAFILNTMVEQRRLKRKKLFCCFVDFRRAFDSVAHPLLWKKLANIGISSKVLTTLQAMYSQAVAKVKCLQIYSSQFPCKAGVRQGCNLSPTLFSLYVNDLLEYVSELAEGVSVGNDWVRGVMFADDLVLVAESEEDLQRSLDRLDLYCEKWSLEVNMAKTKTMVFGGGTKQRKYIWKFRGQAIEQVKHYKYLGIVFAESGSFKKCSETLAGSGLKAIYALLGNIEDFNTLDVTVKCKLFDSVIVPVLEYGSEIWGAGKYEVLERVHMKFCKMILGLPPSATTMAVLGELGRFPLSLARHYKMVKYWLRLAEAEGVLGEAYKVSSMMATEGYDNWSKKVWSVLEGMELEKEEITVDLLSRVVQRSKEKFVQQWAVKLWDDTERRRDAGENKLRTYRQFKLEFGYEPYLDVVRVQLHQRAITRFRVSAHNLHVETGRHHRPRPTPVEDRICMYCNDNMNEKMVEDECHALMVCPKFEVMRGELMEVVSQHLPNFFFFVFLTQAEKFCFIMSSLEPLVIKALAKFVSVILNSKRA